MTDQPMETSHGFASGLSAEVAHATPPDLVTWLREQIDEDERVAQAARHGASGRWVQPRESEGDGRGGVEYGSGKDDWPEWSDNGVVVYDEGLPTPEQAEHIARHDPARVLREVEAKRRIIALHRRVTFTDASLGIEDAQVCFSCHGALIPENMDGWDDSHPLVVQVPFPCKTTRALLSIYADRPGYREEWRP